MEKKKRIPKEFLFYVEHFQLVYPKYLWYVFFWWVVKKKKVKAEFVELVTGKCNV